MGQLHHECGVAAVYQFAATKDTETRQSTEKQAAQMKQERLHLHTGFSTEAINERIRLLNQTLDKKIDIQIIDLEEKGKAMGTKIILHFPI